MTPVTVVQINMSKNLRYSKKPKIINTVLRPP